MPAFGFAFFKNSKIKNSIRSYRETTFSSHAPDCEHVIAGDAQALFEKYGSYEVANDTISNNHSGASHTLDVKCYSSSSSSRSLTKKSASPSRVRRRMHNSNDDLEFKGDAKERFSKDVSVGGGAEIKQDIQVDKNPLDSWSEKPDGLIRLYFVFSEQLEQIIEKGGVKNPLKEEKKQGFMDGVEVG